MSMRRAVAGCVVLACLVALLAERTEGHITFFSPKEMKEMMLMKERVTVQQLPRVERGENPDKTAEIAVRLSPQQLDHVAPVLEEIIHEIVEERQKAK